MAENHGLVLARTAAICVIGRKAIAFHCEVGRCLTYDSVYLGSLAHNPYVR